MNKETISILKRLATKVNIRHRQLGVYDVVKAFNGSRSGVSYRGTKNLQADTQVKLSYPGIMELVWHPSLGGNTASVGESTPVNRMMRELFNRIRSDLRTVANYQPSDLGHLILSEGDILSQIGEMKRILTVYNKFRDDNRYLSKALFLACGGAESDYDDFAANFISYVYQLNFQTSRLAQLAIPKGLDIYVRWLWMSSNIIKDSDVDRAQLYVYRKGNALQYDDTKLGLVPVDLSNVTFQQRLNILSQSINYILGSTASLQMIGDIIHTLGRENLVEVPSFDPATSDADFSAMMVYDGSHLEQLQGIDIVDNIHFPSLGIYQDEKGHIYQGYQRNVPIQISQSSGTFTMKFSNIGEANTYRLTEDYSLGITYNFRVGIHVGRNKQIAKDSTLINFLDDTEDEERFFNRLRFSITSKGFYADTIYGEPSGGVSQHGSTVGFQKVTACGSEIIGAAYVYWYGAKVYQEGDSVPDTYILKKVQLKSMNYFADISYNDLGVRIPSEDRINELKLEAAFVIIKFNWAPKVGFGIREGTAVTFNNYYPLNSTTLTSGTTTTMYEEVEYFNNIDTQNYAWIDSMQVQMVHDALVLDLYGLE